MFKYIYPKQTRLFIMKTQEEHRIKSRKNVSVRDSICSNYRMDAYMFTKLTQVEIHQRLFFIQTGFFVSYLIAPYPIYAAWGGALFASLMLLLQMILFRP